MDSTLRKLVFWGVMIAVAVAVYSFTKTIQTGYKSEDFSQFFAKVQSGEVTQVTVTGSEATYVTSNNEKFRTVLPTGGAAYEGLTTELLKSGIQLSAKPSESSPLTGALIA